MWRKTLLPIVAIAAIALTHAAAAQDAPAPAAAHASYSDRELREFAQATVELQALGSQDPAAMTRVIEGAGLSVEAYNQMGDAMRADPALARNLDSYLAVANAERVSRINAAQGRRYERIAPAPSRHVRATHSRHTRSHATVSRHSRRHATKASHHRASSRHASRTHAGKRSHKSTASSHAAHHRKRHRG